MIEAEYVACSLGIQEVVWLRMFFIKTTFELMTFYCDSMTTFADAKDLKYHDQIYPT